MHHAEDQIEVKKGNLLTSKKKVIAHGCNCHATMGAGVALLIKKKWPEALVADEKFFITVGYPERLGHVSIAKVNKKVIANLYTQYDMGANFDSSAFQSALQRLFIIMRSNGWKTLAMPWIGCGIGGCSQSVVKFHLSLALEYFSDIKVTIYEL